MHTLFWMFLIGFAAFAFFFIVAQTGIAFLKALFWIVLLPLKLVVGLLGAALWLLFLPIKLLFLLILGIVGFLALPVVASVLCLFGLLIVAC